MTPVQNKLVQLAKNKIIGLIQNIFINPRLLNTYVQDGKLSKEDAIKIIATLNNYNMSPCSCCRTFCMDKFSSKIFILEKEFDPLLEIVKLESENEMKKTYGYKPTNNTFIISNPFRR